MHRGVLSLILAMLLGSMAHASEAYIVGADASARLVDARGHALIEGMDACHVFEVRRGLYAVGEPGHYALYDAHGKRFCDGYYEMAWSDGDALILRLNGLCGAMDDDGTWRIEPIWRQLVSNGAGGFLALEGDADILRGYLAAKLGGDVVCNLDILQFEEGCVHKVVLVGYVAHGA